MRNYLLILTLFLISSIGFSQLTPSAQFRVANKVTAFGVNVPVGTQIYCASDASLWDVKVALASTATITTGIASLALVGSDLSLGTITGTTVDVNSSTGTSVTLPAATGTNAGLMTAAEFTTLSNQSGTNTGNQTLTVAGTTSPTIALSGSNTATFVGAGTTTLGQSGGTITITSTEVDGSITNEGLLSVGGTSGAPTIVSNTSGSPSIGLVAGTGMSISTTGTTITLNSINGTTYISEAFEESVAGVGANRTFTLTNTPKTNTSGLIVELNGVTLKPTTEYTSSTVTVTIILPVYQYDRVIISYTY